MISGLRFPQKWKDELNKTEIYRFSELDAARTITRTRTARSFSLWVYVCVFVSPSEAAAAFLPRASLDLWLQDEKLGIYLLKLRPLRCGTGHRVKRGLRMWNGRFSELFKRWNTSSSDHSFSLCQKTSSSVILTLYRGVPGVPGAGWVGVWRVNVLSRLVFRSKSADGEKWVFAVSSS